MPDLFQLSQQLPLFIPVSALMFGLIVGSFLNVVIARLPVMMERAWAHECGHHQHTAGVPSDAELTLATPRSSCPNCGHQIRAWENIPVISWLALRGRCSNCATPISLQYPLVELSCGLGTAFIAWHLGGNIQAMGAIVFFWLLIPMVGIDLRHQLLPDSLTLSLLWCGLLFSLSDVSISPADSIIGAAAGYTSLWLLANGYRLYSGNDGMGYGDLKLLAAIGSWVGWQLLPLTLVISATVGAIIGISLIASGKVDRKTPLPFGPFLALGGICALLWGERIVAAYLSSFIH